MIASCFPCASCRRRSGAASVSNLKPSEPDRSWHSALNRAEIASRSLSSGSTFVVPETTNPVARVFICPGLSREVLAHHEDCRIKSNADNDDSELDSSEEEEGRGGISEQEPAAQSPPSCLLHKPLKPNPLLRHALTSANGADWRRQRPAVSRALGGPDSKPARVVAARESCALAIGLLAEHIESSNIGVARIDVRSFALRVAVRALSVAVVGMRYSQRLEGPLSDMFRETLLPVRGEGKTPRVTPVLQQTVSEIVSHIAEEAKIEGGRIEAIGPSQNASEGEKPRRRNASNCKSLVESLLHFETNSDKACPYGRNDDNPEHPSQRAEHVSASCESKDQNVSGVLSRAEVIANAHSALMAGTQTICTTIAGLFMHMAERPDLQSTDVLNGRSATMETLRVLPPVAGLPRIPTASDLKLGPDSAVKCGELLVVDLLAFAHGTNENEGKALPSQPDTGEGDTFSSTWRWEPATKQSRRKRGPSSAEPWGIGDRRCPAGTLSVECISCVLEGVVDSNIWWRLAEPTRDSVGPCGTNGWIRNVLYEPTICYQRPLLIEFGRR